MTRCASGGAGGLAPSGSASSKTLNCSMRSAGVAPTRDGFASVPEERLHALQEKAAAPDARDPLAGVLVLLQEGLSWGPAVDGELIVQPTIASLRSGVGGDKPLVLGATDDEFTMVTDSAKGKLRLVPVSFALGRLQVPRTTRRAYLADNTDAWEMDANGRYKRRMPRGTRAVSAQGKLLERLASQVA